MLPIVLCVFFGTGALATLIAATTGGGKLKRVSARLAALRREFELTDPRETVTDIRREERKLSSIPWLNQWLAGANLGPYSSLFLYQAGVSVSVGALMFISAAGTGIAACLLYWHSGDAVPALVLSAGFLPLPFLYVQAKRRKRLSSLERQIPEALGTMVSALRAGHSLIASIGAVAQECPDPLGGEIRKCFEEQNFGVELRTALVNLLARAPVQDLRIFVAAVMIQKDSGGNLAEILEKVAQTTRERFILRMQIRVHTAQGRMTGWVLSLLPVVIGAGMYLVSPEGISVLWKRPAGLKLLYTAFGMDVLGAVIIRRIVGIKT